MKVHPIIAGAGTGLAVGAIVGMMSRKTAAAAPLPPATPPVPPPPSNTGGGGQPLPPGPVVPSADRDSFFGTIVSGKREVVGGALSTDSTRRSQQLYQAVRQGRLDPTPFSQIQLSYNGHTGLAVVSSDALKIMGVRINLDQYYTQLVADELNALVMTDVVAAAIYAQAKYKPTPTAIPEFGMALPDMKTTKAMLLHSFSVDKKLRNLGWGGDDVGNPELAANVGKDWLQNSWFWLPGTNSLHCKERGMSGAVPNLQTSVNFGWFGSGPLYRSRCGSFGCIQGAANCHDIHHVDYSQVVRLIGRTMVVDGEVVDAADVIRSRELSGLLVSDGPLKDYRHPAVSPASGGIFV